MFIVLYVSPHFCYYGEMVLNNKTPIYHEETHDFLGNVSEDSNSWVAQTIFGYVIERTTSRKTAEAIVREQGQSFLGGIWQYYDKEDQNWFSCVISDATETQVTVIRTTERGLQTPEVYKMYTIKLPTEVTLIKSS